MLFQTILKTDNVLLLSQDFWLNIHDIPISRQILADQNIPYQGAELNE